MAPMNATKSLAKGAHRSKKSKGRGHGRRGVLTEERMAAERAALLAERQTELEGVLDRHDTLLRESFQLEKFVTMLLYDPAVAKADTSAVWRDYKESRDLLEQTPTTATSSSRTTRRAHTERRQLFKGATAESSSAAAARKTPGKQDDGAIWSILADVKGKGTEKAIDTHDLPRGRNKNARKGKGNETLNRTTSRLHVTALDPLPGDWDDSISQASGTSLVLSQSGSGRSSRKRPSISGEMESISMNGHSYPGSARKKRRLNDEDASKMPPPASIPNGRSSRRLRDDSHNLSISADLRSRPKMNGNPSSNTRASRHGNQQLASYASHSDSASPAKSSITRIKLIVRRPPPLISHPRQRPPPPRFGSSLHKFLSSYTTYNDQDFTEEALEDIARKDSIVLDRIDDFRRQGRLLPDLDSEPGSGLMSTATGTTHKRGPDLWDHVVEEVVARARVRRNGNGGKGRQIASQVASKVQGYWDGYALREDKAKVQEERRLRALAKATIKMVTGEWKKAVFHIREQERLRVEAEERRLGQSHLDAILDQSGQILETQQGDLTKGDLSRSRSRSSSVSATFRDWDVSDEDEGASHSSAEEDEPDDDDDQEELGDGGEPMRPEEEHEVGEEDQTRDSSVDILDTTPSRVDSKLSDLEVELLYPSEESDHVDDQDSVAAVEKMAMLSISPPPTTDLDLTNTLDSPQALHYPPESSPIPTAVLDSLASPTSDHDSVHLEYLDEEIEEVENTRQETQQTGSKTQSPELIMPDETPSDEPQSSLVPTSSPPAMPNGGSDTSAHPTQFPDQAGPVLEDGDMNLESKPPDDNDNIQKEAEEEDSVLVPDYLKPYAVAPVEWDPETKVRTPILLRGTLRPYQQSGLEWLASLHTNNLNGILADEMGLGKTIQTIALLGHLACDQGIWGPHLIIVPTSVLLNWEMEFKKFLPGFKTLSYHGTTKRRKELRQGWNDKHHFNVCITSYTLASRDAHIFKRKPWYYMILDEAHMIKNFKSQRWNILLMFRSFRRLLLTGTPLQNNLTELWALLQFLMSGTNFANLKEFGEWFSNPLEKAIEMGTMLDDENLQRVSKLHTVLRPYLLRRLKRDVEKELPSKYDHLVLCPLSKRQRFLYDEFMLRAQTRESLQSGVYQKIANILMQLRKVCNHPDLFEVRPIVTSFAMQRSAIADFEIEELLIRRHLLHIKDAETLNLDVLGLSFIDHQGTSVISALETQSLDASSSFPMISELPRDAPPKDTRSIERFKAFTAYQQRIATIARWSQIGYLNRLRCNRLPVYSQETLTLVRTIHQPLLPLSAIDARNKYLHRVTLVNSAIKSYSTRAEEMSTTVDKFAFVTPAVVALDMPRITLFGHEAPVDATLQDPNFDAVLHKASVKLQIAFPDPSLLQFDCGKLQELTRLLREKKAGGHRVLIFTQMTRILDILETFLNFHGYLYLRLDGATKIEDRQYITERFNVDTRVFCFIASSRSGGVGINLTGADTVVFYDSDFNPQMDRQCEDRAHRIGQIRDVHIYRFVSSHTVEEAMLLKANQKRSLDDLVIQKGEFDWRSLFGDESALSKALDETALTKALGEVEDTEDAHAAAVAAREEIVMEGADEADFGADGGDVESGEVATPNIDPKVDSMTPIVDDVEYIEPEDGGDVDAEEEGEEGGTTVDYMLAFIRRDEEFFREWRL